MPAPAANAALTYERAHQLLAYSPRTGRMAWRVTRKGRIKAGNKAGCLNAKGLPIVTVDNTIYSAARVAWLMSHGQWPIGRIAFDNGDPADLRLRNLVDVGIRESPNNRAANLRRYRSDRRKAELHLSKDPSLYKQYMESDAAGRRRIISQFMHALRDQDGPEFVYPWEDPIARQRQNAEEAARLAQERRDMELRQLKILQLKYPEHARKDV